MSLWRYPSPNPLLKYDPLNVAKDATSLLSTQSLLSLDPLGDPVPREINHQELLKNLKYTTKISDSCIYIIQDKLHSGKCQIS